MSITLSLHDVKQCHKGVCSAGEGTQRETDGNQVIKMIQMSGQKMKEEEMFPITDEAKDCADCLCMYVSQGEPCSHFLQHHPKPLHGALTLQHVY